MMHKNSLLSSVVGFNEPTTRVYEYKHLQNTLAAFGINTPNNLYYSNGLLGLATDVPTGFRVLVMLDMPLSKEAKKLVAEIKKLPSPSKPSIQELLIYKKIKTAMYVRLVTLMLPDMDWSRFKNNTKRLEEILGHLGEFRSNREHSNANWNH